MMKHGNNCFFIAVCTMVQALVSTLVCTHHRNVVAALAFYFQQSCLRVKLAALVLIVCLTIGAPTLQRGSVSTQAARRAHAGHLLGLFSIRMPVPVPILLCQRKPVEVPILPQPKPAPKPKAKPKPKPKPAAPERQFTEEECEKEHKKREEQLLEYLLAVSGKMAHPLHPSKEGVQWWCQLLCGMY